MFIARSSEIRTARLKLCERIAEELIQSGGLRGESGEGGENRGSLTSAEEGGIFGRAIREPLRAEGECHVKWDRCNLTRYQSRAAR